MPRIIPRHLVLQMSKFVWVLTKHLTMMLLYQLCFYVKHDRVMVIKRGDVTDIACVFAWLDINCLIFNQRETC